MRRFALYAACAAAVALAVWLVAGTRDAGDAPRAATQTSGTQTSGAAGARIESPASAPVANTSAAEQARARSAGISGGAGERAAAARGGADASRGDAPDAQPAAPEGDGASDAPGADSIAPAPSDAPRVLRSLGDGASARDPARDPHGGTAMLPMGFAPVAGAPGPPPQAPAPRGPTGPDPAPPADPQPPASSEPGTSSPGTPTPDEVLGQIGADFETLAPRLVPLALPGAPQEPE